MNSSEKLDLEDCLDKVKNEFDSLESFIENDQPKGDRFKTYLKKLYDYLKVNDDVLNDSVTNITSKFESLPELIVDKNLVDNEQIYQQLQLYNNDTSSSVANLTKFFSKCLVSIDSMSFNVELKKANTSGDLATSNGTTTDNVDSNDGEDEHDSEFNQSEDELDDENGMLSDDSVGNMLKNSKTKAEIKKKEKDLANSKNKTNKEIEFGIPDGSDSEISDFEVDVNGKNGTNAEKEDDDDEDENEEDLDDEDNDEEGDGNEEEDDLDSDEVDEDLVDLYTDLGDEKEVMGIGKPSKSFNQVDFDREDFGLNDEDEENDQEYDNELDEDEKKIIKKQHENKTKDLFAADESDDNKTQGKSSFEIRQSKLKEQVEDIHKSMLNELTDKPWQLQGESTAKSRPKESLLEEYLDFDHTTRQAPIISAKTTEELEAIIKQRIKDKAFDDVERKVKPVDMQYEYKKQVVLDHEKSKLGLGEVYEQEFVKQQNGADDKSNDKTNPKHEEIRKQMQNLFMKLDALSNFHFTPKAPAPEIKVISNMPTINMEEVAPVSVADSNILAPEEIKTNIKKLPKSKSEEDKKDKKKNLRTKKVLAKKKKAKKEELLRVKQALNPDDPKLAREAAMNKLIKQSKNKSKNIKILKQDKKEKVNTAYRSSHAFFQQLQETNQLGSKLALSKKRQNDSKSDKNKLTSKKLKL